ncbi:MAG: dTMP kinase [Gemmatimonadetes bacterium]|nr:dTMP kinase [Gemmatimonadota bacterium]MBI2538024.1 dTMP kinase [Gemmatimonadota bacterium]MBI2614950.1 dTMP kinase [Gemmatimonadota bacterium]
MTRHVPGAFLVVEGPDGAGKTTLVKRLAARLREAGLTVTEVREPGGTPLAEMARRAVLDPSLGASPLAELFLMLAARADLVTKVIRPALAAGQVVLSDRFELSTEAYQIAGRELPRKPVLAANRLATGGLRPDVTLVLDLPADVGLDRLAVSGRAHDRIEGAERRLHDRVARAFAAAEGPSVVHLDATRSVEAVEQQAWDAVRRVVKELIPGEPGLKHPSGTHGGTA